MSYIKGIMAGLRINIKEVNNLKISSQASVIHLMLSAGILIMTGMLEVDVIFH